MIDISQEDFGTLCICALRYCHGRRTYMPRLIQLVKESAEVVKDLVEDEPQTDMAEDIVRSYGFKAESYRQAKAKDEPQTDCSWK